MVVAERSKRSAEGRECDREIASLKNELHGREWGLRTYPYLLRNRPIQAPNDVWCTGTTYL
ncbi:MAG: hypothetical protein OXC80_10735 [Gammaproteobacteria bacterium]|nr:hypothetical protein [Gammaproteobacteria bacterium]